MATLEGIVFKESNPLTLNEGEINLAITPEVKQWSVVTIGQKVAACTIKLLPSSEVSSLRMHQLRFKVLQKVSDPAVAIIKFVVWMGSGVGPAQFALDCHCVMNTTDANYLMVLDPGVEEEVYDHMFVGMGLESQANRPPYGEYQGMYMITKNCNRFSLKTPPL